MEREGLFERLTRTVESLRPENRLGVIAKITVDNVRPEYSHVLIDRGERDVNETGVMREFKRIVLPTRRIIQEQWGIQDLVELNYFGVVSRIASIQELEEQGADTETIYKRFFDWIAFSKEIDHRKAIEKYLAQL